MVLTTPRICKGKDSSAQLSHLGSDMLAACCTRPQYVLRSNCETGRSRFPGSDDVMANDLLKEYELRSKQLKLHELVEAVFN